MKKVAFLFLMLSPVFCLAQTSLKLYAYSQQTTPGTIPVDENGKPMRSAAPSINYYLFATYSPSAKIQVTQVWLKGRDYQLQTSKIDSTPVFSSNNPDPSKPKILVPATKQKVIAINVVGPVAADKRSSTFRNLAKKSELILTYYYNGKKYFAGVKKIKTLPPLAGL
jgi:hypothetical protein